jgi:hypothetical protein
MGQARLYTSGRVSHYQIRDVCLKACLRCLSPICISYIVDVYTFVVDAVVLVVCE